MPLPKQSWSTNSSLVRIQPEKKYVRKEKAEISVFLDRLDISWRAVYIRLQSAVRIQEG